ncbi:MAG TPA: hypothetical protein DSN98_03730 [Thermoplasmata archaeon]|jgi:predicted ribosomally synthesized peptide with SipW-like signal peptide|nr:MAG TPA: hypothetical protein DSN98_03730 [Thermoplasmata archaeon]
MNKKIISLVFLLILLVTVTVSYAYFNQSTNGDNTASNSGGDINPDTVKSAIDSTLLDENQEIVIGEMI